MCTLTSDLYLLLWRDAAVTTCGTDPLWNTLGRLPDCHDCIRFGGPSRELKRIPHEVSQESMRALELISSYVNLCWVIGQFIASGVLVGVQPRLDVWGWKIPFAVQWVRSSPYIASLVLISQIWPIPIIFVCIFCPESPTWREWKPPAVVEKSPLTIKSSSTVMKQKPSMQSRGYRLPIPVSISLPLVNR